MKTGYSREDLKSVAAIFLGSRKMVTVRQRVEYCDVCVTFKEWLAKNGHRFNRKYKIRHYNKGTALRIYFEDVTPEMNCYLYNEGMGIAVNFKKICWDIIKDFDFFIRRNRKRKYYCALCKEPKFYDTPQELLIEHSFENFLEWVNENVTPFHALELTQCKGMTSARIIDTREPDIRHEAEREEFKDFLSGLRKISPGNPPMFENFDNMKIVIIPVIKEKEGCHGKL
ncbi:MAG: hypothetical protein NT140_05725 [Deltaproteobacteria bacterium]|nr:hypothetical protein [Deltaproteobacteria bacterium]